jgi:hypothetical protein
MSLDISQQRYGKRFARDLHAVMSGDSMTGFKIAALDIMLMGPRRAFGG